MFGLFSSVLFIFLQILNNFEYNPRIHSHISVFQYSITLNDNNGNIISQNISYLKKYNGIHPTVYIYINRLYICRHFVMIHDYTALVCKLISKNKFYYMVTSVER